MNTNNAPVTGEWLVEVGTFDAHDPLEAAWQVASMFTGMYLPTVTVTAPDGQTYVYDLAKEGPVENLEDACLQCGKPEDDHAVMGHPFTFPVEDGSDDNE